MERLTRKRSLAIQCSMFREVYPNIPNPPDQSSTMVDTMPLTHVIIFVPDDDMKAANKDVFKFNCAEICLKEARKLGSTNRDPYQRAVYLLGIIANILPELREKIKSVLLSNCFNLVYVQLPRQLAEYKVNVPQNTPHIGLMMIYFGLCVLFLFKTVNETTFHKNQNNWLNALKKICGTGNQVPELFTQVEQAAQFNRIIGHIYELRKDVMNDILEISSMQNTLGKTCSYVARLLCWHDMSGVLLINKTLLAVNSPVLRRPEVALEILRLREALKAVISSDYPQYFRILEDFRKQWVLERANFPILLAVAHKIKERSVKTTTSFRSNLKPEFVQALVDIHNDRN